MLQNMQIFYQLTTKHDGERRDVSPPVGPGVSGIWS